MLGFDTAEIQTKRHQTNRSPGSRLLLLLLSRFSRVRLHETPQTAAHQAPPSLGLSRQERWSGLPFPSPVHARTHAKSLQVCRTLCDPMDRLLCLRDSLGKNTGVGCHFVLLGLPLDYCRNNPAFPTPEPVFRMHSVFSGNPVYHLCGAVSPPPPARS